MGCILYISVHGTLDLQCWRSCSKAFQRPFEINLPLRLLVLETLVEFYHSIYLHVQYPFYTFF